MSSTTGVLIITSVLGFGLIGESKRCTSIETFYYMFLFYYCREQCIMGITSLTSDTMSWEFYAELCAFGLVVPE
jgi:hypothetical protein